jgi:hypothetical protein
MWTEGRRLIRGRVPHGVASAFTFFGVKIPFKAACFEEKIYREVKKVEENREEKEKPQRTSGSPSRTERTFRNKSLS